MPTDPLKALTLHARHATLFAFGRRWIETRSRRFSHRGRLAIHAGTKIGTGPYLAAKSGGRHLLLGADPEDRGPLPMHPGHIVAVVEVTDCLPVYRDQAGMVPPPVLHVRPDGDRLLRIRTWPNEPEDITDQRPYGDFTPGRWAILTGHLRRLPEPVPCRGQQARPWTVPDRIADQVREQLQEVTDG